MGFAYPRSRESQFQPGIQPGRVAQWLGKTCLRLTGWTLVDAAPSIRNAVIIGAPHTSSWDFPLTVAGAFGLGRRISWIGKQELFEGPLGFVYRSLGGIPVDRSNAGDVVGQAAELLRTYEGLSLVIAPEGTRKSVKKWRMGFYHIAQAAELPVLFGFIDFEKKRVGIGGSHLPTGDIDQDLATIQAFYRPIRGRNRAINGLKELQDATPPVSSDLVSPAAAPASPSNVPQRRSGDSAMFATAPN